MIVIVSSIGKKKFRPHLELFLECTFRIARSLEQYDTSMALSASDFLVFLDKTFGENIFKAIVEAHDERNVKLLQQLKEESQRRSTKKDFEYPAPNDIVMTKAPWAK